MPIKYELALYDVCTPDFFGGHSKPYLQINVYNGMTFADVRRALRNELVQGAVGGNCENARLLSADMVNTDEEKQADKITRQAYAAINKIKGHTKGARLAFKNNEFERDADDIYAYFVLVEV